MSTTLEVVLRQKQETERMPYTLPWHFVSEVNPVIERYRDKLQAMLKSQIVNALNKKQSEFDAELFEFVKQIWQNGYSRGLRDMDLMHEKAQGDT